MSARFPRFDSTALLTALTVALGACASDDMGDKTRPTTTSGSTSGGGGASTGSTTSTSSTSGTSTVGSGPTTTTGPSTGNTSGTSTTAGSGGSTVSSGTGGSGGATSGTGGSTGTGGARDAGAGGSRDAGTIVDAKAEADVPLPLCNYAEWSRTVMYKAGDIVMYMGKAYIATGDNTSLDPTISTFYWAPYTGCKPPPPPPPAMCPLLDKLLPNGEKTFTEMFTPTFQGWVPLAPYSYTSLCKALDTAGVAGFVRSGNAVQDKRELAGFFANVALETAYLTYVDESGHSASDQDFHGRGSLQITGQAIYADAGAFLGLNLTGQPQLASQAPVVWQTGLWYWMAHANPSAGGTQVCHQSIAQGDFGHTIRIIKGDCSTAQPRIDQYRKNCMLLSVDPGTTTCQ